MTSLISQPIAGPGSRRLLAVAGVVCLAAAVTAAEHPSEAVRIVFVAHGGRLEASAPVGVSVRCVEVGWTRDAACSAGGDCLLPLPASGQCEIRASAQGFWAAAATLGVPSTGLVEVPVHLWVTSSVGARVTVPPGEPMPGEAVLRLRRSADDADAGLEGAEVSCPIADGVLSCSAPAGTWDVRLRATGFVSHFLWKMTFSPNERRELGSFALRRGGSVVGRIDAAVGPEVLARCRVVLAPQGGTASVSSLEEARKAATTWLIAQPDAHGFFHVAGVAAGSYALAVAHPSYATERIFPVMVAENAETELSVPIVLQPPAELRLIVTPPVSPSGAAWLPVLNQRGLDPMATLPVQPPEDEGEGSFSWKGLRPGAYFLQIKDSGNSQWAVREVQTDAGSTVVDLDIEGIPVAGTVRLGGEPLEATLTFGGRYGDERIRLSTDGRGRFDGVLPRDGRWDVWIEASAASSIRREVSGIEVERDTDGKPARVEIVLPAGTIEGVVVDEHSDPVAGAVVYARDPADVSRTAGECRSDSSGRFRLDGLSAGTFAIQAGTSNASSDLAIVAVDEQRSGAEARLIVRKHRVLEGSVASSGGPVVGAKVFALAPEVSFMGFDTITDVRGRFSLRVPAGADAVTLLVMPTGFSLQWLRAAVGAQQRVDLIVAQDGGRVVLRSEDGGELSKPDTMILLVHDGSVLGIGLLAPWVAANGLPLPFSNPREVILPALAPGNYAACRVPVAAVQAIAAGAAAPTGCRSVVVSPGSTVTLPVPPA